MERVRHHLGTIAQLGDIEIWDDHRIASGDEWAVEIKDVLQKAAASLCLATAPYLSSNFINREEIPALKERYKTEGMLLFPILVKPCAFKLVPWKASNPYTRP